MFTFLIAFAGMSGTPPLRPCSVAAGGNTSAVAAANAVAAGPLLQRAIDATGMRRERTAVLRIHAHMIRELRDLSERSYAPVETSIADEEIWFDPISGRSELPGVGMGMGPVAIWSGVRATTRGDDATEPVSAEAHGLVHWLRAFDAWAVLSEWAAKGDAVVEGQCVYDTRTALRRGTAEAPERGSC